MLSIAKQFVPGMADAVIHDAYVGWRPLPIDGHPVLGASPANPDFYLAIMHSGVSLAPIVGQLVAHELTEAASIERLDQFSNPCLDAACLFVAVSGHSDLGISAD